MSLYEAAAEAAAIPLTDYLAIVLAEAHGLPRPDYLDLPNPNDTRPQQMEMPLGKTA